MRTDRKLCMAMVVSLIVGFGSIGVGVPLFDSLLSTAIAGEAPTTILILQHAERGDFTKTDNDPELTPEGKQRAQELVHAVGNAGIAAVFSPSAKRMVQTVQPLQQSLKLPELNHYEQGSLNTMLQQIRDKYKGKVVLIVGAGAHMGSGGIHEIIKELGCTGPECAAKDAYDNLFVVTVYEPGKATAAKLRYGKPVAQ
ncbi:MAG: histidine phosphatase family protein [Desulfomonilaceae bacterium]